MAEMRIHWTVERMDCSEVRDLRYAECVLQIQGRIECDGKPAGLVDAHYVFSEHPESGTAFMVLWDVDSMTCAVYEAIINPDLDMFLEPIPQFLNPASGILCIHHIGLRPEYRGIGLGREVMRDIVRSMADPRAGLVLLDAQPLQHLPHGYDDFDEEVWDLPWNSPEADQAALIRPLQRC
jgi:GNAT superfamily N-acetyltransferase